MAKNLEIEFQTSVSAPEGPCPLAEPGRGAPLIEQPDLISIQKQPIEFNYDIAIKNSERKRFLGVVQEALDKGEITQEEAVRILKAELN